MLLLDRLRGLHAFDAITAFFLLLYSAVAIMVHGGASRMTVVAALIASVVWARQRRNRVTNAFTQKLDSVDRCLLLVMAAPVVSVLLAELLRGDLSLKSLDTPLRFLIVFPVFFILRRVRSRLLMWADLSFALGGMGALIIFWLVPGNWGGRAGSYFLNPIHFGDIALILGVLSALSVDWWKRDTTLIRLIKVLGSLAGFAASVFSGARGGWIVLPLIAMAWPFMPRIVNQAVSRRLLFPSALCLLVGASLTTNTVQHRLDDVATNYQEFLSGNKDTSVGIRVQLYIVGGELMARNPILGLGANGFHDAMQPLADAGVLTPAAAELGRGETHNQILLFLVDFGVLAGLAILAIHLVPGIIFWRQLRAVAAYQRRAALMGVILTLSFFVFGMTVEIFNLKTTISFYTTVLAVLLAIALHSPEERDSPTGEAS